VVLENDRHVPGVRLVDRPQAPQQEVRRAHALVAELLVGPGTVVLPEKDLVAGHGVLGAGLDMGAHGKGCGVEGQRFCHARVTSSNRVEA
jgi:hypothetical protein